MNETLKNVHWTDVDFDDVKGKKIDDVVRAVAHELFEEGYSETLVYAFLHKTVDLALYHASIDYNL